MNSGPLPSTAGGPAGSNGSVDGVINGTSALLDNIVPYAIGRSARTGSDRNYQQIPHRYQYIIPKIWLPDFTNNNGHIAVSHAVDQGDIAFLLYGGSRAWWTSREQFAPRAPQCAFAGIDVVNYILACIQASRTDTWERIRQDMLGRDELFKAVQETAKPGSFSRRNSDFDGLYVFNAVRMLVQQYFVPHGICAGSERQGGQHEHDGGQSVIAPVNFVITMTVDGKNVDLVNYWYDKSMLAGDELIFRLEKKEVNTTFNLSSYYKQSQQTHVKTPQPCWQLVPDLLRQKAGADPNPCRAQNAWYHHRCQGYWRVAQTFQTRAENNINAFHRGMPLEVTFAPVWQSFTDCRDVSSYGKYSVDSTTVTQFTPTDATSHKELFSVATKKGIEFFYEIHESSTGSIFKNSTRYPVFKMESAQNHYKITSWPKYCQVYLDADKSTAVVRNGDMISKQKTGCLHVLVGEKIVPQTFSPHRNSNKIVKTSTRKIEHRTNKKCDMTYEMDVLPSMQQQGADYLVRLYMKEDDDEKLYDADFLRCYDVFSTQIKFNGDIWERDLDHNYKHLSDEYKVTVKFVSKSVGSAPTLATVPLLTDSEGIERRPSQDHTSFVQT
jgi:hypothetical protein